jgi:hypothetical protein
MDNNNKQGKEFHLNTQNYTLEQVKTLSKVLLNKSNLKILFNLIRTDIEFILKQNKWINLDHWYILVFILLCYIN